MGSAMEDLERRIRACILCRLHESRKNAVPGEGPYDAKVMFIGEAPGRNENINGLPFCGSSGKFLNELLKIAGLRREEAYITSVTKCRPPKNRVPRDDEIEICTSNYLRKQIAMIKPKLIVTLGRTSTKEILNRDIAMAAEHGKELTASYHRSNFRLFVTYHPAAALYGADNRRKLKEDFAILGKILTAM